MARAKREYDVLLGVTMTKVVRVRAHSMKEARSIIYGGIPDEDQHGMALTEHVGAEFVADVVRVGESWNFERRPVTPTENGENRG